MNSKLEKLLKIFDSTNNITLLFCWMEIIKKMLVICNFQDDFFTFCRNVKLVLFCILYFWMVLRCQFWKRNSEVSLSVGISEVRSVQSVNLGLPVIARFESETVNQSSGFLKILFYSRRWYGWQSCCAILILMCQEHYSLSLPVYYVWWCQLRTVESSISRNTGCSLYNVESDLNQSIRGISAHMY